MTPPQTFVIAEAGSTHDGQLDRALALISAARLSGADAVKFQTFDAETLAARRRASSYYLAIYRRYAMPLAWLPVLAEACRLADIEFMTTVYHADVLPHVAPWVRRWKIASFEALDREFVGAVASDGRPVIISTGMAEAADLIDLARWLRSSRPQLAVRYLLCTSAYPAPVEELNLAALRHPPSGMAFAGLSDHSRHLWTGALAVAAGAAILEAHVRLNDTDPANPDCAVSFSPAELRAYIVNVRLAERMCGDGVKRAMPSEAPMLRYRAGVGART